MASLQQPQSAAAFRGLYRIFLRALGASVLEHRVARRSLREIWRPSFKDAARALKALDGLEAAKAKHPQAALRASPQAAKLRTWLADWENKVDGTLELLANSAGTRGLPHRVVKNMHELYHKHRMWHRMRYHQVRHTWNGQLPPGSPEYTIRPLAPRLTAKNAQAKVEHEWDTQAWRAMSEVMHLAEARDRVEFGKVVRRKVRETLPSGRVLT